MAIDIRYYSSTFANQNVDNVVTEMSVTTWVELRQAITAALQNAQDNNHDVLKIKIMRR